MIQKTFALNAVSVLEKDPNVLGLAVGGSWISGELDQFSDLDLVLITQGKVSDNKGLMLQYAGRLGQLLSGFTGEHVGEPRVLICLYDNPLLHVDIKYLTLPEFEQRVENPEILLDKTGQLQEILKNTNYNFPYPDFQWIEDRFWIWVHYALLKIGRGEYLEAYDFMAFLRMTVFGPLLHIKNNNLPRGVRKVETELAPGDFENLLSTLSQYDKGSLLDALENGVNLYIELRTQLFSKKVNLHFETQKRVLDYWSEIKKN